MAAKDQWLGAEAELEGRPLLVRARTFAQPVPANRALQTLMVMERAYPVVDGIALPSHADYETLKTLERDLFDDGEALGLLMLVLVETGAGRVRYYAYVADPEAVRQRLDEVAGTDFALDLAADEDPNWHVYRQMLERIR